MTLTDLIKLFRIYTHDKAKSIDGSTDDCLWSDEEIGFFLDQAQEEAAERGRLLFDKTTSDICTIDIVEDTSVYDLDCRVLEITNATAIKDGDTEVLKLNPVDRVDMDRLYPDWRTNPFSDGYGYIQDDTHIEFAGVPAYDYAVSLEVYRLPLYPLTTTKTPEISAANHKHLLYWAMHLAYSVNENDKHAARLAAENEMKFTNRFGQAIKSDTRKRYQPNKAQHNKLW